MQSRLRIVSSIVVLLATAAAVAPALGQSEDKPIRIGYLTDVGGPSSSNDGAAGVDAARMAIEDLGGKVLGRRVEICGRSPRQSRHRRRHHQTMARRRRRRCGHGHEQFRDCACRQQPGSRHEQDFPGNSSGVRQPHRQGLLPQSGAVVARHLFEFQSHRVTAHEERHGHLVLHQRRLCARTCAGELREPGHRRQRRQGARDGQASVGNGRLRFLDFAGAGLERQGSRDRESRGGYGESRQTVPRISAST